MHNIIALGCSLTRQDGYIKYFNEEYSLNIKNYAVSGGSNQLQCHKLNNAYINGDLDESTILIWQITSPSRAHALTTNTNGNQGNPEGNNKFNYVPEKVSLFNKKRYALLHQHPCIYKMTLDDYHENLQNLIIEITHWSYVVKKIIVHFGWTFFEVEEWRKIHSWFSQRENILLIPKENCICDWVIMRRLPLADDFHPTEES